MARRLALVVALAVTVVVGFALLALGAVDFGSGGSTATGAAVAPVSAEVRACQQPAQSSGPLVTPLPSSEHGDDDRWESANEHEDGEHEEDD